MSIYKIVKSHISPFYYSDDDCNGVANKITTEIKQYIADHAQSVMQRARTPTEQDLIERLCELVGANSN